jgi:acyl-CoA synthetase (AMP-forming)/AMP-acid ligase II
MNISNNLESAALCFPLLPALCENGQDMIYKHSMRRPMSRLSSPKVPKEYIVSELTKNPTGKILKRAVKKQILEGTSAVGKKEKSQRPRKAS